MFKFTVRTYWIDQTGYYIRSSGNMDVIVYAEDSAEAIEKAKKVAKNNPHSPRHDYLKVENISAEEVPSEESEG